MREVDTTRVTVTAIGRERPVSLQKKIRLTCATLSYITDGGTGRVRTNSTPPWKGGRHANPAPCSSCPGCADCWLSLAAGADECGCCPASHLQARFLGLRQGSTRRDASLQHEPLPALHGGEGLCFLGGCEDCDERCCCAGLVAGALSLILGGRRGELGSYHGEG